MSTYWKTHWPCAMWCEEWLASRGTTYLVSCQPVFKGIGQSLAAKVKAAGEDREILRHAIRAYLNDRWIRSIGGDIRLFVKELEKWWALGAERRDVEKRKDLEEKIAREKQDRFRLELAEADRRAADPTPYLEKLKEITGASS